MCVCDINISYLDVTFVKPIIHMAMSISLLLSDWPLYPSLYHMTIFLFAACYSTITLWSTCTNHLTKPCKVVTKATSPCLAQPGHFALSFYLHSSFRSEDARTIITYILTMISSHTSRDDSETELCKDHCTRMNQESTWGLNLNEVCINNENGIGLTQMTYSVSHCALPPSCIC